MEVWFTWYSAFPSKCQVLCSNPSTTERDRERRREGGRQREREKLILLKCRLRLALETASESQVMVLEAYVAHVQVPDTTLRSSGSTWSVKDLRNVKSIFGL
jgi:hypothetical protein